MIRTKSAAKKFFEKLKLAGSVAPKYQHPKILLIDTVPELAEMLEKEGYNVSRGTFGSPYQVQKSSSYKPVVVKASLPNCAEQEIIVVDLLPNDPEPEPPSEKMSPAGDFDWWAKCSSGIIDPRPRIMSMVREKFDRILDSGGVFIIFSDQRNQQIQYYANHNGSIEGYSRDQYIDYDNWSFLSLLSELKVSNDEGQEINVVNVDAPLLRLLSEHLSGSLFYCTIEPGWRIDNRWGVLAKNKYGVSVAGFISPANGSNSGWVFVLPRIKNVGLFLSGFLKNVLPDLCPRLFPHAEGQKWVHRVEYELPSVLEKVKQISDLQDEAAKKILGLEEAIEADRQANKFLYALIRETGAPLVEAVKNALDILGFKLVVDVDEEMTKEGKQASLREDLRIHDHSPILVVDIKGVAGKPSDAEALQAQKHAFIYIQEQSRADVRGLSIINHQRLLPPLERDNEMPFRKEILDNAEQVKLGLMTGWDLFRLVRGFINNKWRPEQVSPLFYQTGRILPIPRHYVYVGKVKQVWKAAFSVEIEQWEIRLGDSIAVEFPVDFHEQHVTSLQLKDGAVEVAAARCEVGIQREDSLPKVKSGMQVYIIKH